MKLTKEGLAKTYQEQTSRVRRGEKECISPDLLARAAVADVNTDERELVAAHLASCSDCAEEYRIIASLEDWAQNAADSTSKTSTPIPKIESSPTAGMPEPKESGLRDKDNVVRPFGNSANSSAIQWAPYAMAASFLILCIMLGFWAVSLRRENDRVRIQSEKDRIERDGELAAANQGLEETQRRLDESLRNSQGETGGKKETEIAALRQKVDELSRPQLNIPIADLEARGTARGGAADDVKTVEITPGTNSFTVILNVSGQPAFNNYLLEIQDHSSKTIWSGRGLRKSAYNTFTLGLPAVLFSSGDYRLNLYGVNASQKQLVQEYAIRIVRK